MLLLLLLLLTLLLLALLLLLLLLLPVERCYCDLAAIATAFMLALISHVSVAMTFSWMVIVPSSLLMLPQ